MFRNNKLHGQGKRINPNQFIEHGHFEFGYFDHDFKEFEQNKDSNFPLRINWNEYFSSEHHTDVINDAISKEKQDQRRYKDLLSINKQIYEKRSYLQELFNNQIMLIYGPASYGKSTLASKFISFMPGQSEIKNENGKFKIDKPIHYKNKEIFQINHFNQKTVGLTEFFPIDENNDLYLVEYPYENARNMCQELPNICNMQYILNNCLKFQLVLLLNAPDFCIERGAPMIEYLTRFLRILS